MRNICAATAALLGLTCTLLSQQIDNATSPNGEWNKRRQYILEKAAAGDATATAVLASWVRQGIVEGGITKAEELATTSAASGSCYGKYELARIREEKKEAGSSNLFREALPELHAQATQGNADALLRLGRMYLSGWGGLPQDVRTAAKCFIKAGKQGLMEAIFTLGEVYESRIGGRNNPAEAYDKYVMAANMGYPPAQFKLATVSGNGSGINLPPDEARSWLQKAADQDFAPALVRLALSMDDKTQAFKLISQAAEAGDPSGIYNQAYCYAEGRGVEQDEDKAFELYQVYLQTGDTDSSMATDRAKSFLAKYKSNQERKQREQEKKDNVASTIQSLIERYGYGEDGAVQYFNGKDAIGYPLAMQWMWPDREGLCASVTGDSVDAYGKETHLMQIFRLGKDWAGFTPNMGFYSGQSAYRFVTHEIEILIQIYPKFKEWEAKAKEANLSAGVLKEMARGKSAGSRDGFFFHWDGEKASLYFQEDLSPPRDPYPMASSSQFDDIYFCALKFDKIVGKMSELTTAQRKADEETARKANELLR
jgi:TPR repeat protein